MALVVVDKSKAAVDIEGKPGIVGSKYYVDKRIGEGSFGVIYKGNLVKVYLVFIINAILGVECRRNHRVAIKFVKSIREKGKDILILFRKIVKLLYHN